MLPSMPLISTPYKDHPPPVSDPPPDPGGATVSLPDVHNSPPRPVVVTSPPRTPKTTPGPHPYLTLPLLSLPLKKSSPLKLVNPILKKYNTHRHGKILKRSVSPMHNGAHISFSQAYLHPECVETTRSIAATDCGPGDSEADLAALMAASSTVPRTPRGKQAPVNKKKRLKELRDAKVMLALLAADSEQYRAENARSFAQAYYHKLQERLEENDDGKLFCDVLRLLGEFEPRATPVRELYERVVSSLHAYPDLAELFNACLLPEQAIECGTFMEHLKLTNMKTFVRKLEIFFAKQPQQFRQVLSTLTALSEQPNVTVSEVKASVVPLLKSNSFLVDSLLLLFPAERPPESLMTDFEEMEMDSEQSGDDEESVAVPDKEDRYGTDGCVCPCHGSPDEKYASRHLHCFSCGTKFIHGKVYVHIGRVLRPAKVSFPGFTDEAVQQRLYVKVNRKARRKNFSSPSKTPQISPGYVPCDVKTETDDEQKSSSPKSCKIAKLKSPGPSPRVRPRPNGTEEVAPALLRAESPVEEPASREEDGPFSDDFVGPTVVVRTSLESMWDVEEPVLPPDLILPAVEEDRSSSDVDRILGHSAVDAETSTNTAETTEGLVRGSLVVEPHPMNLVYMEPDTTKSEPALSPTDNTPAQPMIDNEVAAMSIDATQDRTIATILAEDDSSTSGPIIEKPSTLTGDSIDPSTLTGDSIDPSTSPVVDLLSRQANSPSTFSNVNIDGLSLPQKTNCPSTFSNVNVDGLSLPWKTNCSSTFWNVNVDGLSLPEKTNCPSTFWNVNDDGLSIPEKTNCPSTFWNVNIDGLSLPGQTNHPSTSANNLSTVRTGDDSTLSVPSVDRFACLVLNGGTKSLPTSASFTFPSQTYDWSASNNDRLTLTVENNYPADGDKGNRDDGVLRLAGETDGGAKLSSRPWTREEDRLILVEVQKGFGMEETFVNIKMGLPHRAMEEIRERFHMLMKILQEMTDPIEGETKSTTTSTSATV